MTTRQKPLTYLQTSQVADILHVADKTVSRWAKDGKLPFLKTLGGHRRYPEAEIRALADSLQGPPPSGPYFNPPRDEDERGV